MSMVPRKIPWLAAWRNVGGNEIFFRSRWEANYARYLELLKKQTHIQDWLHEPQYFIFENIMRGTRTYLPDFKIIKPDGSHYWVEVKGFMDAKSRTKIKRFAKYFPDEKLVVIEKNWFIKNAPVLSKILKDWE